MRAGEPVVGRSTGDPTGLPLGPWLTQRVFPHVSGTRPVTAPVETIVVPGPAKEVSGHAASPPNVGGHVKPPNCASGESMPTTTKSTQNRQFRA